MDLQKVTDVNEKIGLKMVEDKDFCLSIVNCKNRDEVKTFLKSNGISATDSDIDILANNISEVADICARVGDKELEKIVGGQGDEKFKYEDTSGIWTGLGVAGIITGGLGIVAVLTSGIKVLGDKKGWWTKKKS